MRHIALAKFRSTPSAWKNALLTVVSMTFLFIVPHSGYSAVSDPQNTPAGYSMTQQAKIQLAILLDTSGSMDGLIDQARTQLWQVVNEFSKARQNGVKPTLEVAVYEYGNDGLSANKGYIRQVSPLTPELDRVSEALFSLTTNGGSEYCGYVIHDAAMKLQWSNSINDIKSIFIAGNEPFTQGPMPFKRAIRVAKSKGITVNTIHAGGYDEGARLGWLEGAMLAGGSYMSIDQNHKVAHVSAPQDEPIAELNNKLNRTYLPYGVKGAAGQSRQKVQDSKSDNVSAALLSKRAKTKASSFYDNSSWDLVDAMQSGSIKVEELTNEALPIPMQAMSLPEKQQYLREYEAKRRDIKRDIMVLSKQRDLYISGKKIEAVNKGVITMESALISVIRKQGEDKMFEFEE